MRIIYTCQHSRQRLLRISPVPGCKHLPLHAAIAPVAQEILVNADSKERGPVSSPILAPLVSYLEGTGRSAADDYRVAERKGRKLRKSVFELSGAELDYAVARAAGLRCELQSPDKCTFSGSDELFEPSVNWMQGGPIIELAQLRVEPPSRGMKLWSASAVSHTTSANEWGATLLEAAMRCFVALKLGPEVAIAPMHRPRTQDRPGPLKRPPTTGTD